MLGDRGYAGQGLTTRAVSRLLRYGFAELGLESVGGWAIGENVPSIRVLRKNSFRPVGTLRRSHRLHEVCVDRLVFDLLTSEYRPVGEEDSVSTRKVHI